MAEWYLVTSEDKKEMEKLELRAIELPSRGKTAYAIFNMVKQVGGGGFIEQPVRI